MKETVAEVISFDCQNRDEMHASVKYIVAHGVASTIGGRRVVIGSQHFVFEDEGCTVPEEDQKSMTGLHLPELSETSSVQ